MSVSNGKISAPISVREVYDCLGVKPGKSNGYDVGYICSNQHHMINMWSKKKPVHIEGALFHTTDDWWKGTDGTCGIDYTNAIATSVDNIPGKYSLIPIGGTDGLTLIGESTNGWNYNPPKGGAKSPYRLEDFNGYDHNADPPVKRFTVTQKVATGGTLMGTVMYAPQTDSSTSLSFGDIMAPYSGGSELPDLDQYYLGMVITNKLGNTIFGRVAGGGFGKYDVATQCTFLTEVGTYRAYPFLSPIEIKFGDVLQQAKYLTLPVCTYSEFQLVATQQQADDVTILLSAKYQYFSLDGRKTGIQWSLQIISHGATTLSNNAIYMYFSTSQPLKATLLQGEKSQNLPDISLSSGKPYTQAGTFTINSQYADKSYYLYATFKAGYYTTRVVPLAIADPGAEI